MARRRRQSKGKKINPTLWVFCEGETEESYIKLLKSSYRLPSIQIHPKIKVNAISTNYIENYKQDKPTHEKDMDFLVYDLDVEGMLENLKQVKNAILCVSNPCIELWFLLHHKNQKSNANCEYCCKELKNRNKQYNKGIIDGKLKDKLVEKQKNAVQRAKALNEYSNPSTTIYRLIEILDNLKSS